MPNFAAQEEVGPKSTELGDSLLECLVILTQLNQRHFSRDALRAGLPLVDHRLTPSLFVRAAERAGFAARIVKRPLKRIANLVLPAVLILQNNQACILQKQYEDQTADIIFPESGGITRKPITELTELYTGYVIFIQPVVQFEQRTETDLKPAETTSWFWGTLWRYHAVYAEVLLASLLINIFTLASPLFIMNVYDRVVPNYAETTLWVLAIGVLIIYLFDFILRILRSYFIDICGKKADILMASSLFERVLGLQLAHKPTSVGGFANHLREFEIIRDFFTSATLISLVDLPFVTLFLLLIWFIGGPIVWIPGLAVPLIFCCAYLIEKPLSRVVKQALQGATQKHAILIEAIAGLETLKCLSAEGQLQRKWEQYTASTAQFGLRSRFLSSLVVNIATYTQQLITVGVIVTGVYLIHAEQLTLGGLIACSILASRVIAPLAQMANLLTRYQQAKEALHGLNKIMALPQERPSQNRFLHLPKLKGNIEFNQVSFQYPEQQGLALNKISFKISAGERVGIIGRVGSGKSTIQKLLLGLYTPQEGNIHTDNIDIRQLDPVDLRRNIGYVPQDSLLFFGNVRDNIAMGTPWATDTAILQAAQIAGVNSFVNRHPAGYNMSIGERGEGLSGGQRQAIALARAILNNPAILLFDEPTSAMDNMTEQELLTRLKSYLAQKTLLLVTHKLTLLPLVERLIVVDNGHVVVDGSKEKVLTLLTPTSKGPAKA